MATLIRLSDTKSNSTGLFLMSLIAYKIPFRIQEIDTISKAIKA